MESLLIAMAVIAIAELGDKTQLLALLLANRLQRPLQVAAGLVVAMIGMHALAAFGGAWIDRLLADDVLTWLVGIGFILLAVWMAASRGHSSDEARPYIRPRNAFLTSLIVFSVLEFGDKSQLGTVGLAIALEPVWMVAAGAALGSILVNLPVIWLGWRLERRIPYRLFHWIAAASFALIGLWLLRDALG